MTPEERRDTIREELHLLAPLVAEAFEAKDWEHFGYETWGAYVEAEFGSIRLPRLERQAAVVLMRLRGMSTRAIAHAIGVSHTTVERDLSVGTNVPTALPEKITTVDGKTYPATRQHRSTQPSDAEDPVPEASPVSHPAKFSEALYGVFDRMLPDEGAVLDPFAGVGGIHRLGTDRRTTVGVELEPEWANQHQATIVGNALCLPFDAGTFDAICTAPAYGNRMADSYDGDGTTRHTYRIALGRKLTDDNAGAMHWGSEYRLFHVAAWIEAVRVLRSGGVFVLNISDHIRGGERQRVTAFHIDALTGAGLRLIDLEAVKTPRNRNGANAAARVRHEYVIAFEKRDEETT